MYQWWLLSKFLSLLNYQYFLTIVRYGFNTIWNKWNREICFWSRVLLLCFHSDGDYCFEILKSNRSSRNLLTPVVRPSLGFSARELKKVCGQGSLYLRLIESGLSEVPFHLPLFLVSSLPVQKWPCIVFDWHTHSHLS